MDNNETNDLLREIVKWQRLQGMELLRKTIPKLLSDDKKRLVYEMTDGQNSQLGISQRVGVASGTVSNWWTLWYS